MEVAGRGRAAADAGVGVRLGQARQGLLLRGWDRTQSCFGLPSCCPHRRMLAPGKGS